MLSNRMRRLAWLACQWRRRALLMCCGRAVAEGTIEGLRRAWAAYQSFSTMADPSRSLVDMLARSRCVLACVKQWTVGFEQHR